MSKFRFTLTAFALVAFSLALSSAAQAQATRTWVSGVGDDANPCSRTAPCKTYAGAISKTAVNGEISTLDPGGFGALTITKSITVEGTQGQGYGSVLHSGTNGITINYDSFSGEGLTQKTVRLRNLNVNGSGGSGGNASSGFRGIRILGTSVANTTNSEVYIENTVVDGSFNSPGQGIIDTRAGGGLLRIDGCTIRNMLGAGIGTGPPAGATSLKVIISNTSVSNCGSGLAVSTNGKATVFNSVFTNNATGILSEDLDGGTTTEIAVDHCVVSGNTTGFNGGANSTIRVSNTTAMNNNSLFAGSVLSYGNNQTGATAFSGPVSPS